MIKEILLVLIILYILAAIYFGLIKKMFAFKIIKSMFKILAFIIIVGIAIALIINFY